MTQYLVAIRHPDPHDPSAEDEAMSRDIDARNDEMVAAGVRIFVGGLSPASSARSLRVDTYSVVGSSTEAPTDDMASTVLETDRRGFGEESTGRSQF